MKKSWNKAIMDPELYRAATRGDCSIFAEALYNKEYFLQQTQEVRNNIIHLAARQEQEDFVRKALTCFPELICQPNSYGQTPFHFAAETGNLSILDLLLTHYKEFKESQSYTCYPWRVKNFEGNTSLHVALIHGKLQYAAKLVEEDPELTDFVNNSREAPLHLAIKHYIDNDRELVQGAMKHVVAKTRGATFMVRCPLEESSGDIVALLLQKNSYSAFLRDSDGLTPLLVAASLKTPYVFAIKSILDYCPQSIEVCDFSGKTMLHLVNEFPFKNERPSQCGFSEYLLSIPEIHGLKNHQDFDGNTPAHVAVKNHNILMVQLLFRLSANFAIKNKEGLSAAYLIQQNIDEFKGLLTAKEEDLFIPWTRIEGENEQVEKLLSKLQQKGLQLQFESTHLQQHGNVLHMLFSSRRFSSIWREKEGQEFIKQVLDTCPALICETDIIGDTPLHQIARHDPSFIDDSVLKMFGHYFNKLEDESGVKGVYVPPWRIQDVHGNTPLHRALLLGGDQLRLLREFLKFDIELVKFQNHDLQTPLHLLSLVSLSSVSHRELEDFRRELPVETACRLQDKDGLSPILKAAQDNKLDLVKLIFFLSPASIELKKKDDRKIVWHLLASHASLESNHKNLEQFLTFFNRYRYSGLYFLGAADNDGNTPLHLAIEKGNFRFAKFIIERAPVATCLNRRNNKDVTPADLIGSAEHIPHEFKNFLWSKLELVEDLMVVRSLSGVSTSKIENYANTIGVIAALLATVTFTAAFTVPGGLDDKTGAPLLMKKAAFQVFMVSDVLAMCLSMMVLFCLQWIMTMSNKKESVVLLDLSIFLLEAAFYATLLAFMMGLYATTSPVKPWVAILSCVLCSSLILLMHKRFFAFSVPCFIRTFFVSQRAFSLLSDFVHLLLCGIPKSAIARCSQQSDDNNGDGCSIGHNTKNVLACCSQQSNENNGDSSSNMCQPAAPTDDAQCQRNWRIDYAH